MCGRVAQYHDLDYYLRALGAGTAIAASGHLPPRYNIGPGTNILALHRLGKAGNLAADPLFWNYRPTWADLSGRVFANAPLKKLARDIYYRTAWQRGRRILIPLDGWYRWLSHDGVKWPHFTAMATHEPLFAAAICQWHPGSPSDTADHGMALIVTFEKPEASPLSVDGWPVLLAPIAARSWLDPAVPPDEAMAILHTQQLDRSLLLQWRVMRAVSNGKWDRPEFIKAVS